MQRIQIPTPDDDLLDLEWMETSQRSAEFAGHHSPPVVILLHGLEGNANRYYIMRLADMLLHDGFDVAALHFRSCSGRMNKARRFYHSGETDDLATVIRWILHQKPGTPIFLAGFSLGASVILNFLAKSGPGLPSSSGLPSSPSLPSSPGHLSSTSFPEFEAVQAFAAVSAPFDLKAGSEAMNHGFAKIYQLRFLQSLEKKLVEKRTRYADLPDFHGQTLYEFDDQVTAPLHGFDDAEDYYHQCSSGKFIERIQTPGLILHSKEDPICPFETVPLKKLAEMTHLQTVFPDKGGHVGFWSLPPGWQEEIISRYFKQFAI